MLKSRDERQLLLIAGLAFLLLFVVFTFITKEFGSVNVDHPSEQIAEKLAGGMLHPFFDFIEPFGSPEMSLVLGFSLAVLVGIRQGLLAGAAVLATLGLMTLIEGLLRLRLDDLPWDHLFEFLRHPRGWHLVHSGYPSGHTARLALLAVIAAYILLRQRPWIAVLAVTSVTAWIGVQRVEAGRHSGADVIGGALLGWGFGLVLLAALPWFTGMQRALTGLRASIGRSDPSDC